MAPLHCIALTGGPCGGKSSALKSIQSRLKEQGVNVYLVPEVPTIIMQGGAAYPGIDGGNALVAFETAIIQLQFQMEQSFVTIAKSTGMPSLIICDRGLLDIAAYLPREAWLKVLESNNLTEEQMLKQYDGVLHLVTAADGAEKFYKHGHVKDDSGNDVYRAETPEMARELDRKMFACWSNHRMVGRIGNESDGIEGKLARATDFVCDVISGSSGSGLAQAALNMPSHKGYQARNAEYGTMEKVVGIFRKSDSSGRGQIKSAKVAAILTALGLSSSDTQAVIHTFDQSGDGVIEYEKFLSWCSEEYDKHAKDTSETVQLPNTLDDVNEEFLTQALQHSGLLDKSIYVSRMNSKTLGSDCGMLGDKMLINLFYESKEGGQVMPKSAPSACVVKLPPKADSFPRAFVDLFCKTEGDFYRFVNLFCKTEGDFYRKVAPDMIKMGLQCPKCYFIGSFENTEDPKAECHVLVLEHMTHPEHQPRLKSVDVIEGIPMQNALLAVKQLAGFHAAFWNLDRDTFRGMEFAPGVPKFYKGISHLSEPGKKTNICTVLRNHGATAVELFGPETCSLPEEGFDGFRTFGVYMSRAYPVIKRRLTAYLKRLETCTLALTHGDAHVENIFLNVDGTPEAIWFDFQGLSYSAAMRDVAFLAGTSLSIEDRRTGEQTLVKCYHDALLSHGIKDYTFEQCYSDYKFCLLLCLQSGLGVVAMKYQRMVPDKKGPFADNPEPDALRERMKLNTWFTRVSAALEDSSCVEFLQDAEEDSEENNPSDLTQPCNFG